MAGKVERPGPPPVGADGGGGGGGRDFYCISNLKVFLYLDFFCVPCYTCS